MLKLVKRAYFLQSPPYLHEILQFSHFTVFFFIKKLPVLHIQRKELQVTDQFYGALSFTKYILLYSRRSQLYFLPRSTGRRLIVVCPGQDLQLLMRQFVIYQRMVLQTLTSVLQSKGAMETNLLGGSVMVFLLFFTPSPIFIGACLKYFANATAQ